MLDDRSFQTYGFHGHECNLHQLTYTTVITQDQRYCWQVPRKIDTSEYGLSVLTSCLMKIPVTLMTPPWNPLQGLDDS